MTVQLNMFGLMANGYRIVARYEMFSKGKAKLTVECWQGNSEYLIKFWEGRKRSFTLVYQNKAEANKKFIQLKSLYTWAKKVR